MIHRPHPWSKGLWRCLIKNVSTVNNYVLIWVDRPTRLLNTCMVWFSRLCYNLAFTSMSLSERHVLHDITDGSLKTWSSSGCCCIRYHLLLRILFDGRGEIDAGELICHWMDILSREKLHFSLLLSCFWQPCEYVMISFIVGLFSFAVGSLWNVVGRSAF